MTVADDKQEVFWPGQCHVQSAKICQEAHVVFLVCSHTVENYDRALLALEAINCIDENVRTLALILIFLHLQPLSKETNLALIWSDDTNLFSQILPAHISFHKCDQTVDEVESELGLLIVSFGHFVLLFIA